MSDMKTIEIPDKMYQSLIEIGNKMANQSHRGTAMPYFFQVLTHKKVPAADGCGTTAWMYDGSMIETDEEIKDAIFEWRGWEIGNDVDEQKYRFMDTDERERSLREIGFREISYEIAEEFKNAFFTEDACKQHIQQNSHHYNDPKDYLSHAFRNPEMELVQRFLMHISGNEFHL